MPGDLGAAYQFASVVRLRGGDALVVGGYDASIRPTDGVWRFRR